MERLNKGSRKIVKNTIKEMGQISIEQSIECYSDYYKVIKAEEGPDARFGAALLNNKQELFQIELMTESPTELIRKPQLEVYSNLLSGIGDHHTSPITSFEPDSRLSRMSYATGQAPVQGRKIFGFEIFVDNDILAQLQPEYEWFEKVRKAGEVETIKFNLDLNIPDLNGRNIQIYDREMDKKYLSCQALLSDIYQVFKKVRRENFSIIIFVPQGMVSLLIGTKGYQINKIMRQSRTTIVVNQPINRMTYRTVKIQGYHPDIAKACRIIYQILEDKSSIAYSIEKEPSQLDYSKARVKTKFILCASLLTYLTTKKKLVLKKIEQETKCIVKLRQDTSSRLLKREEELCVLVGRLDDVQAYLVMLINLMQLYYDEDKKGHDYIFKMLIPSNYVTKLIGQKGYMIRDITQRSGGAQIKILSDRQSERDARQCIISINGTRQNKIDATCLILEQIQCFKNGGPILQSGKSINQNLAQQFKNSLPLHKCEEFFEEAEIISKQELLKEPQNLRLNSNIDNDDNHDEEGLISAEEGEQVPVQASSIPVQDVTRQPTVQEQNNNRAPSPVTVKETTTIEGEAEPVKQRVKQPSVRNQDRKALKSPSRRSAQSGSSPSRSRKKKRNTQAKGGSSSSSPSYQQEKQYVQVKLVVPRKLAQDHRELKYIQSLCHSEISVREQRVEGTSEAIISVRGSLKDNSQCIKMLQKRILRLTAHSSTR